jgi:hypothetical protein
VQIIISVPVDPLSNCQKAQAGEGLAGPVGVLWFSAGLGLAYMIMLAYRHHKLRDNPVIAEVECQSDPTANPKLLNTECLHPFSSTILS